MTLGPLASSSPFAAIRTSTLSRGMPTDSGTLPSRRFTEITGEASVIPYPWRTGSPSPRNSHAIARESQNDTIQQARFAALGAPPRRCHQIEKPLLRRRFRERLVDARGEFFEHARHREHHRRALAREVLCELRDRAGVSDLRADRERQVVAAGALEHVRKGKQGEKYIVTPREAQALTGGNVREDVAVREHHPLRPACSPRGVANRGKGTVFQRRDFEHARLLREHCLDPVMAAARIGGEAQHARQRRGSAL